MRARYVLAGLPDRATSDQIERARAREAPEFDRFLDRVKRDAFEKGIATGYMRGYHDSEVGASLQTARPARPVHFPRRDPMTNAELHARSRASTHDN